MSSCSSPSEQKGGRKRDRAGKAKVGVRETREKGKDRTREAKEGGKDKARDTARARRAAEGEVFKVRHWL